MRTRDGRRLNKIHEDMVLRRLLIDQENTPRVGGNTPRVFRSHHAPPAVQ